MEVSRLNYLDLLPEILEKLENASFVSFDAEYTGLKGEEKEETSLFDTTAQRYQVLRSVVHNNSAPQFGISTFQRLSGPEYSKEQAYKVDAYCFYVSEACFADFNMKGVKASIDIDCIQFLNGIQFDFAQWLKHPVPYLNENKVKELTEYLDVNPNLPKGCRMDKNVFPPSLRNKVLTEEDKKEIIRKLRGISVIVDVISKRKIPVVGHNMILDLMYFFHQFCRNLPEDYEDFKAQVAEFLPVIYDTKYMTVRCRKNLDHPALKDSKKDIDHLRCSGLYMIYTSSSNAAGEMDKFPPKIVLSETCQNFSEALEIGKLRDLEDEENSPLCHKPSFDACVTGIVFLNLAYMACRISKTLLSGEEAPGFEEIIAYARHWQDQIFVARASVMTMVVNLTSFHCLKGADPRPKGSWVTVTSTKEDVDVMKIINALKVDPAMEPQLRGLDYQQVSPNEVIFAVSRTKSAYELVEYLEKMGYQATRMMIPWDKKRYDTVDNCKTDLVYDTGRNKLLS